MITRAFEPEHLTAMHVQPEQVRDREELSSETLGTMAELESYTILSARFEPLVCFGFVPIWQNRGYIWLFASRYSGPHFTAIHREMQTMLDLAPFKRLEAYVAHDFEQGHRWVKLSGFEKEASLSRCLADGRDAALYVRFN